MKFAVSTLKPLYGLLGAGVVAGLIVLAMPPAPFLGMLDLDPVWNDSLLWLTSVLLAGCVLRSWVPRHAHLGLLGLVLLYLVSSVGLAEASIVMFWLASTWSCGAILLRWCYADGKNARIGLTEAFLVGTLVWLGVVGAMLHFPFNFRSYYLGIGLLPLLCLHGLPTRTAADLRAGANALHDWMRTIPFWAWVAGLAIIGWTLRWSAFPSVSFDDHAAHLRLWAELLTEQRALFDVRNQIWSVAPFASDLLYASLSLMAGADARSATNLILAVVLLALMMRILHRLQLPSWVQWLLAVLMASTPMFGNLLLTMQTELMLAVVGLAGLRLALDAEGGWRGRNVLGVLACCALCAAIKLPGAVFGATFLAVLAVRSWRARATAAAPSAHLNWPALLMLVPLAFVALHSYVLAWITTGNPLFPLYNAIFKSPLIAPTNFSDPLYIHGFGIRSYIRVFFETSKFFECGDYAAGWQYLLLLPLSLIAAWRAQVPGRLRLALLPLLGFGLIMFAATQYWRYLFPVMPIAGIVFAALFLGKNRRYRAAAVALAIACIVLNLAFYTRISWLMASPAGLAYTQDGKRSLASLYAPAAVLAEKANQLAPGSRLLYPLFTPQGATLHGTPLYTNWYAPSRQALYLPINSPEKLGEFLQQEKVDLAILNMMDLGPLDPVKPLLREHMAKYGSVLAQEGTFQLYRLSERPIVYQKVFDLRAAMSGQPGAIPLLMPAAGSAITASAQPNTLAVLPVRGAKQARYSISFTCPAKDGYFVAQVNWDKGPAYYRLVACGSGPVAFTEALAVPAAASQATIYVTARDTSSARIEELTLEVN